EAWPGSGRREGHPRQRGGRWRRGRRGRQSLEEAFQRVALERLVLNQALGHLVQGVEALPQDRLGLLLALPNQAAHLFVDGLRDLLAVVLLLPERPTQKDHLLLMPQRSRPELFAHPELTDHLARQARRPLDVV